MNIKKTIFFLIGIFCTLHILAQPPQKMSYQAVVRDANNQLVVNQQVGVKISILEASPNGFPVFAERHQPTTNANGLMSLEIGTGVPLPTNNLTTIDWGNNNFYLQCEIDITGGTQYTINGVQQLITVPYAFFAHSSVYADSSDFNNLANRPTGNHDGDILYWSTTDSEWHILPAGSAGQVLTMGPNGIPLWYTQSFNNNFPPTITTDSILNFTGTTTYVNATIVDQGTTGIIASGVCWSSTNPYPSLGNNHTSDGSGIGSFTSFIPNLTPNTTYYIRAYATNSIGTSYGAPLSFTTPTNCGTVTDWDGNVYQTTYIGNQCWMKENLKTTHYSNGVVIPQGTYYNNISTSGGLYILYFVYNDVDSNKNNFGYLYPWGAIMNGAGSSTNNPSGVQGICPTGWHLPSHAEWCQLENYLEPGIDGTCSTSGYRGSMVKKLAKPQYWNNYPSNLHAPGYWRTDTSNFNTSGFSAIPGGYIYNYYNGSSYRASSAYMNETAYFWSCTSTGSYSAFCRTFSYNNPGINSTSEYRNYAMSVRCLKN